MPALPQLDGVAHSDVVAAGVRFHIAEAGAGDPVVLVHGWPQHWWCWRKVMPLLAAERRVICLDLRGFGWSDAPPGAYDKATFAADIVAVLDALGLDRVDLVAHDWGAWAGFLACLDRPDRFRSYLALNMYPPWPERRPSPGALIGLVRLWYQVAIAAPGLGRALVSRTDFPKRVITTGAVHPEAWTDADLESFAAVLREPARARASVRLYRTFLARELRAYAAGTHRGRRLRVPTLLLHGTCDVAVDHRRLGDWQTWADRMSVELRDDSGHFIAEELPGVVADRALALSRAEL